MIVLYLSHLYCPTYAILELYSSTLEERVSGVRVLYITEG